MQFKTTFYLDAPEPCAIKLMLGCHCHHFNVVFQARLGAKRSLYYKPMTIVIDDSRVVTTLKPSLTDDTTVVIYDRHMFIVQATDVTSHESNKCYGYCFTTI